MYVITCSTTGERYVGSSRNIGDRWISHQRLLRKGTNACSGLQRWATQHGVESLALRVECLVQDASLLLTVERSVIGRLMPELNGSVARKARRLREQADERERFSSPI